MPERIDDIPQFCMKIHTLDVKISSIQLNLNPLRDQERKKTLVDLSDQGL